MIVAVTALRYVPVLPLLLAVALFLSLAAAVGLLVTRPRGRAAGARAGARVLLVGAVAGVLVLTLDATNPRGCCSVNLVPGAGIIEQLENVNRALGLLDVAGNVAMFAPVGLLAPVAMAWTRGRTTLACLLLSLLIEGVQTATGRIGDIDDVLLNALGGLLGALAGAAVATHLSPRSTDAEMTGTAQAHARRARAS